MVRVEVHTSDPRLYCLYSCPPKIGGISILLSDKGYDKVDSFTTMYHYFPILKVENWCLVASRDSKMDTLSILISSDEASVHQIRQRHLFQVNYLL